MTEVRRIVSDFASLMLIGIVSDTHGHVPFTRDAVRVLESFDVESVIHCGDIGSTDIVSLFSAWPTHFVRGNVDDAIPALQLAIAREGQSWHDRFGSLMLAYLSWRNSRTTYS